MYNMNLSSCIDSIVALCLNYNILIPDHVKLLDTDYIQVIDYTRDKSSYIYKVETP